MKHNMKPFDKFLPQIHNITNRLGAFNVRLFGSMARGNATASSDLDLLIDLAPGRDLLDLISIKQELEAVTGFKVPVSLLRLSSQFPDIGWYTRRISFSLITNSTVIR